MHKIFKSVVCRLGLGVMIASTFLIAPIVSSANPSWQAGAEKAAQSVTINGKVKTATASTITVLDDQNAEQTVVLDNKTKITKAGKAITAADIKANDVVVIVANKGDNNTWTAASVTIGSEE